MERLTGPDASFLYMETPNVHMHTLKVAIIDLPVDVPYSQVFDMVRMAMEYRLHLVPRLRLRPVEVPGGLHHPMWVKDPHFRLGRHLFRTRIDAPGGQREMDQAIGEIASLQLPRDRPLWETWLLEGLAEGGIVLVTKIHHALADGVASATMLGKVMDLTPDGEDESAPIPPWIPEQVPPRKELVAAAVQDQQAQPGRMWPLLKRTTRGGLKVLKNLRHRTVDVPAPFSAPRTVFNRAISPDRSFATASLPLAELKAVKNAARVTLNDVVLATVAGALERFFDARGETPRKPLVASVPMAVATPGSAPREAGNRVTGLMTSLCNDIPNLGERLQKIHEVTRQAKEVQHQLGEETALDWSEAAPAGLYRWALGLYSQSGFADHMPPPANIIVSNVRGPDQPLYVAGARLRKLYSVGPVVQGIGLNITGWSYCGELNVSLIADAKAIPDPHVITDALRPALDDLVRATGVGAEKREESRV
jgi:WS/DGAT/MGAT family acyltransferase